MTFVGRLKSLVKHVMEQPDPTKAPKKWRLGTAPGELRPGAVVLYRDEKWFVSRVPPSWDISHFVHIAKSWYDVERPQGPSLNYEGMAIHADCIQKVFDIVGDTTAGRRVTLTQLQRQERAKAGLKDVDDDTARLLRPLTLDQVYKVAARFLTIDEEELRGKYGHLNLGMQRMHLGNRIRSAQKG